MYNTAIAVYAKLDKNIAISNPGIRLYDNAYGKLRVQRVLN